MDFDDFEQQRCGLNNNNASSSTRASLYRQFDPLISTATPVSLSRLDRPIQRVDIADNEDENEATPQRNNDASIFKTPLTSTHFMGMEKSSFAANDSHFQTPREMNETSDLMNFNTPMLTRSAKKLLMQQQQEQQMTVNPTPVTNTHISQSVKNPCENGTLSVANNNVAQEDETARKSYRTCLDETIRETNVLPTPLTEKQLAKDRLIDDLTSKIETQSTQIDDLSSRVQKQATQLQQYEELITTLRNINNELADISLGAIEQRDFEKVELIDRYKEMEREKNQALEDYQGVENSFSELHHRYEKMKAALQAAQDREEAFKKQISDVKNQLSFFS